MPAVRLARWVENFGSRHGPSSLRSVDGRLRGDAEDGSFFEAIMPFSRSYSGPAEVGAFIGQCAPPDDWGVFLVRKGGFAVARLTGELTVESKTGQRHVQGRTKAGGQSQQRFARRRDNQARVAFEAAADHAARIVGGVPLLVVGGDHVAVTEVLADSRLASIEVVGEFLTVPDPRRSVLEQAVLDAGAVSIEVSNA